MRICDLDHDRPIVLAESSGILRVLDEAAGVGKIVKGVNTTPDVQPGEIPRQAAKMRFKTSKDGVPPTARTDGKYPKIKEGWKGDLAGLAVGAGLIAGGANYVGNAMDDIRIINNIETQHFQGIPGEKIRPMAISTAVIDGKPAIVWWGKGKHDLHQQFWNYADEPQAKAPVIRDLIKTTNLGKKIGA
jgi:hypothetical protein